MPPCSLGSQYEVCSLSVAIPVTHWEGAPLETVWGFIDCTILHIMKPSKWQCAAYNRHKKIHTLKFQAIMLSNSIFGHLFGPDEGCCNNNHLSAKSGFLDLCAQHAIHPGTNDDDLLHIWYLQIFSNDPAYGVSNQIISPYVSAGEWTEEEKEWRVEMASVRIDVEHGFSIVTNTWPLLNAGWKMHVYCSPVRMYYQAGVLFTNVINCMRYN
jgi:hypothetical protein